MHTNCGQVGQVQWKIAKILLKEKTALHVANPVWLFAFSLTRSRSRVSGDPGLSPGSPLENVGMSNFGYLPKLQYLLLISICLIDRKLLTNCFILHLLSSNIIVSEGKNHFLIFSDSPDFKQNTVLFS